MSGMIPREMLFCGANFLRILNQRVCETGVSAWVLMTQWPA